MFVPLHLESPLEDSVQIGQQAANLAAEALETLGKQLIRQKANDIARQIEIYLSCHTYPNLEALSADAKLAAIAVQRVGQTGYSAVHDTQGINRFHVNPELIGADLRHLAGRFQNFWEIIEQSLTGESEGYYEFKDYEGNVRKKYMVCHPVWPPSLKPHGLVVAVTIFMDEFLQPSREIHQNILTLLNHLEERTRAEKRRADQLRAINEVGQKISAVMDVEQVLPSIVASLQEIFSFHSIRVYLKQPQARFMVLVAQAGQTKEKPIGTLLSIEEGIEGYVARSGQPHLVNEESPILNKSGRTTPGETLSRIVVPIKIGCDTLGILDVQSPRHGSLDTHDLFTVQTLADQIAIALENSRMYQELREMAVVEERNRIAREIHDTLAQGFAGILMQVEALRQSLNLGDMHLINDHLMRIQSIARENLNEARRSVLSLKPPAISQQSLEELIQNEIEKLTRDLVINVQFHVTGSQPLIPTDTKQALYRIAQEALSNVRKHSQATAVQITLVYNERSITLCVQDNGIGFNSQAQFEHSFGITCMRERARMFGGMVNVHSEKGKGTTIEAVIPV